MSTLCYLCDQAIPAGARRIDVRTGGGVAHAHEGCYAGVSICACCLHPITGHGRAVVSNEGYCFHAECESKGVSEHFAEANPTAPDPRFWKDLESLQENIEVGIGPATGVKVKVGAGEQERWRKWGKADIAKMKREAKKKGKRADNPRRRKLGGLIGWGCAACRRFWVRDSGDPDPTPTAAGKLKMHDDEQHGGVRPGWIPVFEGMVDTKGRWTPEENTGEYQWDLTRVGARKGDFAGTGYYNSYTGIVDPMDLDFENTDDILAKLEGIFSRAVKSGQRSGRFKFEGENYEWGMTPSGGAEKNPALQPAKHYPRPAYSKCNAGHELVEVYDERRNAYVWDCPSCIARMRTPNPFGTAWTGQKAHYISPAGTHGKVEFSELAMATGVAGQPVQRYALWSERERWPQVVWAQVEHPTGKWTEGLPSEVLPTDVRRALGGFGRETLPASARSQPPPPALEENRRLWAASVGLRGKLDGWAKNLPAGERRRIVEKVIRKDGYATAIRRLNFLVNVSSDPATVQAASADMAWAQRMYRADNPGAPEPHEGYRRHKLLPVEVVNAIPPLYSAEKVEDPIAVVKYFSPYSGWTWYAVDGEWIDAEGYPVRETKKPPVDFLFFGLVKGLETELGYFTFNELATAARGKLPLVERDLHFKPTPLSALRETNPRQPYAYGVIPAALERKYPGSVILRRMQRQYGPHRGRQVFYAWVRTRTKPRLAAWGKIPPPHEENPAIRSRRAWAEQMGATTDTNPFLWLMAAEAENPLETATMEESNPAGERTGFWWVPEYRRSDWKAAGKPSISEQPGMWDWAEHPYPDNVEFELQNTIERMYYDFKTPPPSATNPMPVLEAYEETGPEWEEEPDNTLEYNPEADARYYNDALELLRRAENLGPGQAETAKGLVGQLVDLQARMTPGTPQAANVENKARSVLRTLLDRAVVDQPTHDSLVRMFAEDNPSKREARRQADALRLKGKRVRVMEAGGAWEVYVDGMRTAHIPVAVKKVTPATKTKPAVIDLKAPAKTTDKQVAKAAEIAASKLPAEPSAAVVGAAMRDALKDVLAEVGN